MHLFAGLDDIGTGSAKTKGFTFITMPEPLHDEFKNEGAKLLLSLKRAEFHAKDFGTGKRKKPFIDFMELIRDIGMRSLQCRTVTCLYDASLVKNITEDARGIVKAAADAAGVSRHEAGAKVIEEATLLAVPLISVAKYTDQLGEGITMAVEIASDPRLTSLGRSTCTIDGVPWEAACLVKAAVNQMIVRAASKTPQLGSEPVSVVAAKNSLLVQAADVFGNFFLNWLRCRHGAKTRGVVEKAQIVETVFGDFLHESEDLGVQWSATGDLTVAPGNVARISQNWHRTEAPSSPPKSASAAAPSPPLSSA